MLCNFAVGVDHEIVGLPLVLWLDHCVCGVCTCSGENTATVLADQFGVQ